MEGDFGTVKYINQNCWLAKSSGAQVLQRCRYCRLRWRDCLSFQFLVITLSILGAIALIALIGFPFFTIAEAEIMVGVVLLLAFLYGLFFNKGADKITETSYQVEVKVNELEQKITEEKEILENTRDGILVMDMTGKVIRVNNGWCNITGVPAEESVEHIACDIYNFI